MPLRVPEGFVLSTDHGRGWRTCRRRRRAPGFRPRVVRVTVTGTGVAASGRGSSQDGGAGRFQGLRRSGTFFRHRGAPTCPAPSRAGSLTAVTDLARAPRAALVTGRRRWTSPRRGWPTGGCPRTPAPRTAATSPPGSPGARPATSTRCGRPSWTSTRTPARWRRPRRGHRGPQAVRAVQLVRLPAPSCGAVAANPVAGADRPRVDRDHSATVGPDARTRWTRCSPPPRPRPARPRARNRAVLALLADLGLRVGELVGLDVDRPRRTSAGTAASGSSARAASRAGGP